MYIPGGYGIIALLNNQIRSIIMKNGIKCTHLATGYPVEIPLNYKEMQLATDKSDMSNDSWDIMCDAVLERTGIEIIGQMELDQIVINGIDKPLH